MDTRDIDNDGLADIVYVALDNETFPLLRNAGPRGFTEVTFASGLTRATRSMAGYSPAIYDLDNDGWKDLFVSRGHVQSPALAKHMQIDQHNTVFRTLGKMRFAALTEAAGLAAPPPRRHRGTGQDDFNGDGRIDVVVSALGAPAELWITGSGGDAHWLTLALEGRKSNRDAIGARIKIVAKTLTQYNHVSTAVGYASSSAGPVHFGLGPDAIADLVEIRWPSGVVQELRPVKADRTLRVREPL